ncbi:MAG: hypothetical protein O6853_07725 [Actinobacteria bacterium]|nr:hypothetical protein [Actinomycetota bacterium]MCZ6519668.1 hypothetical protein [Actinomycetota bacterium]MCZ6737522.1 hypothetical protein [Actinomycetota bacterium]
MFLDLSTIEALLVIGGVGAVAGLIGGFIASATNLFGSILMGIIGAISLSAILRIGGMPSVYAIGDDFSLVWGAVGGLLLGFVVGRSD